MNWIERAAEWLWNGLVYVASSIVFAVFAGALAKHALDVQAKKHPFFGVAFSLRLVIGISLSILAYGVVEQFGLTGWRANAVANLIGFGGIELALQVALARLRAIGVIGEVKEEGKPG